MRREKYKKRTKPVGLSRVSSSGNFGWIVRIYHDGYTAGVLMSDGMCGGARAAERAAKIVLAKARQRIDEAEVPLGIESVKQILKEEKSKALPSFLA